MGSILIVEDETDTSEILSKLLTRSGHSVVTARNGWEALLALDHHVVELVLLDLRMPGMDGETFLGILRNDRRRMDVPVIVLSASDTPDARAKTSRLGVQEFLVKANYSFSQLMSAIERHLVARSADAPGGARRTPTN